MLSKPEIISNDFVLVISNEHLTSLSVQNRLSETSSPDLNSENYKYLCISMNKHKVYKTINNGKIAKLSLLFSCFIQTYGSSSHQGNITIIL